MLRTTGPDISSLDGWNAKCQAMAWSCGTLTGTNLGYSTGQATYGRDMILDKPFVIVHDKILFQRKKQIQIENANENAKRLRHMYNLNDKILLLKEKRHLAKQECPTEGPYQVLRVKRNGTLIIQR